MNIQVILPQLLREIRNLSYQEKTNLLANVELLPSELDDFCTEVEGILDANFDERVYDWMREKTSKDQMLELATLIDIADPGLDPEWIEIMNGALCNVQGKPEESLQFVQPYAKNKKGTWYLPKRYKATCKTFGNITEVTFLDLPKSELLQFKIPVPTPHIEVKV